MGVKQWFVQLPNDSFDEVYADSVDFGAGGALIFMGGERLVVAYAAAEWKRVTEGEG